MKLWVRILLSLIGALFILSGLFLLAVVFDLGGMGTTLDFIIGDFRYLLAALIVVVVGALIFMAGLWTGGERKKESINQFTSLGELRISFKAIESMVMRISRQIKGIRDTTTRIAATEQGLVIYLKVKVLPDINIPGLVEEMQEKVREYIQDICGTTVAEVKVLVENMVIDQIT